MSEPIGDPDPTKAVLADRSARIGSAMELAAMALAAAAGFAAPTDWNITAGLAIIAAALFAIGFFALTGSEA